MLHYKRFNYAQTTLVLEVSLLTDDIDDFVVWVSGYYYLYTNQKLSTRVVLDDFHEDYNNGYAEYDGQSLCLEIRR